MSRRDQVDVTGDGLDFGAVVHQEAHGSGTYTLQIQAGSGFNVGDMTFGTWVVLDGTGDDASLRGQGTVTGTFVPDGVSDLYTGWLALR